MPIYDATSLQGLHVNYLFKEYPLTVFGASNERRLKSSSDLIEGFITDVSGDYDLLNLYDSSSENYLMVDKLLDYRLGNEFVLDDITYEDLNYTLARLIYVYLNLMKNGIVTEFDTTDSISSGNSLIDSLFEIYVLNESHKLIKTWKNFIDSDLIELRPVRKKYTIDQDTLDLGYIYITENLPNDTNNMYLYHNGEFKEPSFYSYLSDSTSLTLNIDSTGTSGLNVILGDIFVLDSYISVDPLSP